MILAVSLKIVPAVDCCTRLCTESNLLLSSKARDCGDCIASPGPTLPAVGFWYGLPLVFGYLQPKGHRTMQTVALFYWQGEPGFTDEIPIVGIAR